MLTDARHALRRWSRRPAFTAVAILTLALGIGATTAIFSVADAVLLRPLPWPEPDRLVAIYTVLPEQRLVRAAQATWNRASVTWPTWTELRASPAFSAVAAWSTEEYTEGDDRSEIVPVIHASSALLPMLGARPGLGRFFTADEDIKAERVVVISHDVWQRRFGGRSSILGETLQLAFAAPDARRATYTVVGVLPPAFRIKNDAPEFIVPIGLSAISWRETDQLTLDVIGKLAPNVSLDAAAAAAAPIVQRGLPLEQRSSRLVPLAADVIGESGFEIALLLAGAGLLLIISCSNVAGLLLGDAWARRSEVAVRLALGGDRRRLLRQLGVEHLLLAGVASVVGLMLAVWLTPVFVAMAPGSLPRLDLAGLDARMTTFAIALGVVTSLVFGIVPSLTLASTPAAQILAGSGREGSPRRHRAQRIAVAAQLALALVLIVGASLLGETIFRLTSQPIGFDPRNVAVISATFMGPMRSAMMSAEIAERSQLRSGRANVAPPPPPAAPDVESRATDMFTRLAVLPNVVAVADASAAPFVRLAPEIQISTDGCPANVTCRAQQVSVRGDYFRAMGVTPLRGRVFEPGDTGTPIAVVSRAFEQQYLGGDAIGRRFARASRPDSQYVVVGVVPDVPAQEFSDEHVPTFYRPGGLWLASQFVVRTSRDPAASLPLIREAFRDYDPRFVVTAMTTMEERLARSIAVDRFRAILSAVFGGAAFVLAAIGLYGLAARRVADRRHEMGVRVALGARPRDLQGLIVRDGLKTLALGLGAGLPATIAGSQLLRSYLFGVSPTAPHVFLIAFAVLALAALAAMVIPARRAGRVDVMETLRT